MVYLCMNSIFNINLLSECNCFNRSYSELLILIANTTVSWHTSRFYNKSLGKELQSLSILLCVYVFRELHNFSMSSAATP